MTTGKIILITLLAGVVSVIAGILGQRFTTPPEQHAPPPSLIPQASPARTTLPDFSLPDLEGRQQRSSQWAGRVLILNFWATWCPPCRSEIPDFIRMQKELGDKGLQFVGIAIDDPEEVKRFAATAGFNYPVLVGGEGAIELSRQLGNRFQGLPFSVIFDPQGRVIHAQNGVLEQATIEKKAAALL